MRRLSIPLTILVFSCASQPPSPSPQTTSSVAATPATVVSQPAPPIAEEGLRPNETLIFGHDYKFALTTPEGLVTDQELARNLRLDAVYFRPGSSWNDEMSLSTRVMPKTAEAGLAEIIAKDETQYRVSTPKVEVSEEPPILLSTGEQVKVRSFREEFHSLHEAVAYLDQPKTVTTIVLRGNSDEEFAKGRPFFEALVKSYRNLDHSMPAAIH